MLNNFIKLFFLLLLTALFATTASAQKKTVRDSRSITVRRAPADRDREQLNDPAYKYDRIVAPHQMSIWERFLNWLLRKFGNASDTKAGQQSLSVLQYVIIIIAVVAIILLILKNEIRSLFYGKSASIAIDFTEIEDDINKIDFEAMIADAVSKKDFRKATRLHFLRILKQLTDRNIIRWQIDKTNNDYLMELADKSFRGKFAELTRFYEYVWYGDFPVDEKLYLENVTKFKKFSV